jgi:hypothetical protein
MSSFYSGTLPAASNRADFRFQVELLDPVTNDFVDFTSALITVALRSLGKPEPALVGTNLDGHIILLLSSTFQVQFTRTEMTQFAAGELDMGITAMLADGVTYQIFSGQIPIVDGVVSP